MFGFPETTDTVTVLHLSKNCHLNMARTKQNGRMTTGNNIPYRKRSRDALGPNQQVIAPKLKKPKVIVKMNKFKKGFEEMNQFKASITNKEKTLKENLYKHQEIRNRVKQVMIPSCIFQLNIFIILSIEKRKGNNSEIGGNGGENTN